jgi:hypothetical protein
LFVGILALSRHWQKIVLCGVSQHRVIVLFTPTMSLAVDSGYANHNLFRQMFSGHRFSTTMRFVLTIGNFFEMWPPHFQIGAVLVAYPPSHNTNNNDNFPKKPMLRIFFAIASPPSRQKFIMI